MKTFSDQLFSTASGLRKPLFAALLLAGAAQVQVAQAATLPNGAVLNITNGTVDAATGWVNGGSYFGMEQNNDSKINPGEKTAINLGTMSGTGCVTGVISIGTGIPIGSAITASGSHGNCINGTESPAFDKWEFFGNTGMDYIRVNANPAQAVVTDNGNGTLVFSGWTVTWNGIAAIPMNARAWQPLNCSVLGCSGWTFTDGNARFQWNGTAGGAYTLDYTATVPNGDPSGFGNVPYYLHLVGTVTLPPFTLTDDNSSSPPGVPITIDVVANDTPTGYTIDPNSVVIVTPPSDPNATLTVSGNTVTYTPGASATLGSVDTFTYRVTGNNGIISSPATVSVTVSPARAVDDSVTTDGTTLVSNFDIAGNDTTVAPNTIDPTTVAITTVASHGTVTNNHDGTLSYQAVAGFTGTDTLQYTVQDSAGNSSNTATVSVAVRATAPASSSGAFAPGATAAATGGIPATTGGGLTTADVGTDSALSQQCVGGCFDVSVGGLANGASTQVVLPLSVPIPTNAVYRKSINGAWQDFSSGSGNAIASAAAVSPGICPQAGSSSYTSGLIAGNECVQLTLVDGGADDADGLANGTILDPSGVGVKAATTSDLSSSTSGCSLTSGRVGLGDRADWLLLLGFIAWLGMVIRRKQNHT